MHFDGVDLSGVAEAEVHARIVSRGKAAAREDIAALAHSVCRHKDLGTDGIARALGTADKLHLNPVVMIVRDVAQQRRMTV